MEGKDDERRAVNMSWFILGLPHSNERTGMENDPDMRGAIVTSAGGAGAAHFQGPIVARPSMRIVEVRENDTTCPEDREGSNAASSNRDRGSLDMALNEGNLLLQLYRGNSQTSVRKQLK